MRRRTLFAAAAAVALTMMIAIPGGPAGAGHTSGPYFDLDELPATDIGGAQIFDDLETFVGDYPYRLTGTPNEILAGQFLYDEATALGYESSIVTLVPGAATGSICGQPVGCVGAGLKAVRAIKRGTTNPDEWIMFVGHYDTVPQTIDGAYDNGAGTNLILQLAREFANVETNRSLAFTWYNGEEEGLLASEVDAEDLKEKEQKLTAVLGFDMVGIAWPVKTPGPTNCLCMFHGPTDGEKFRPLLEHVNFDFLGFPNSSREVTVVGANSRNSDERSFAVEGFPTLRWAGMRSASHYPAYHLPDDTIEKIVEVAGGEEYYEQGVENTMKSAYFTALALDNHAPVPDLQASVDGLTVTLDASGSTDEDGELTGFSWDLGDGSSAEGAQATHTFSAPGTYTVTLTVADNLWSNVTRTATAAVTVG
jgi:hypothetical protein